MVRSGYVEFLLYDFAMEALHYGAFFHALSNLSVNIH